MLISYRKNIYSTKAYQDKKKTSSRFTDTERKVQSILMVNFLQILYQCRKQYFLIVDKFKTSVNLNSYTQYYNIYAQGELSKNSRL